MSNFRDRFRDSIDARRMAYEPPKPEPKADGFITGWNRDTGQWRARIAGTEMLLNPCTNGSVPVGGKVRKRGGKYGDRLNSPRPKKRKGQLYIRKGEKFQIMALFTIYDTGSNATKWYIGGHQPQPILVAQTLGFPPIGVPHPVSLTNLGNGQWIVPTPDPIYAQQYSSQPQENWIQSLASKSYHRGGGWWFGASDEANLFNALIPFRPTWYGQAIDAFSRWESVHLGIVSRSSVPTGYVTPDSLNRHAEVFTNGVPLFGVGQFYASAIGDNIPQPGGTTILRDRCKNIAPIICSQNSAINAQCDYEVTLAPVPDSVLISVSGTSFGESYGTTAELIYYEDQYPPNLIYRYTLDRTGVPPLRLHPNYGSLLGYSNLPPSSNLVGENLLIVDQPDTAQRTSLSSKITTLTVRRYDLKAPPIPSIVKAKCWPLVVDGQPYYSIAGFSYHPV